MISFFVPGIAETKGSWKSIGKGRMIPDNPRAKAWETAVGWAAKVAWFKHQRSSDPPYPHAVSVQIVAYLPILTDKRKDRDVDKLARAALDAMNGIVYVDDKQVVELHVEKLRGIRKEPGMLVMVSEALSDIDRAGIYAHMLDRFTEVK